MVIDQHKTVYFGPSLLSSVHRTQGKSFKFHMRAK